MLSDAQQWQLASLRVRAELEAQGFVVHGLPAPTGVVSDAWVLSVLEAHDALGVVLLESAGDDPVTLHWWWVDPRQQELVYHSLRTVERSEDAAEVLAVRAAELAVAALEAPPAAPVTPTPVPVPVPVPEPTPVPARPSAAARWRIAVGFGPLWTPGGLDVLAGPSLDVGAAFGTKRRFGVSGDVFASVLRSPVSIEGAAGTVGLAMLRLHAMWWPATPGRLSPSLGVGGGTALGWVEGRGQTAVGLVSVTGGLSITITPRLAAAFGFHAGVTGPRFDVRSGTRSVASAGLPLLDGWIGLQLKGVQLGG